MTPAEEAREMARLSAVSNTGRPVGYHVPVSGVEADLLRLVVESRDYLYFGRAGSRPLLADMERVIERAKAAGL